LIRRALSAQARLARASLFQAESPLMQAVSALQINRPELGGVYSDRQWSPGRLLAGMARRAPDPELSREDYPHLASDIDLMARYLRKSLARRRKGVNILLHGSPGAGKTQLSRLLGKSLEAEVFEVDPANADGESSHGTRRFAMLATMQKLLAHRRALIVFDETDQVFSDGNWFAGVRSTADRMRPWLVDHLESNPVPTIWIGNDLRSLDPAFARRFDIVLEMKAAPRAQRTAMIRQHAGAFLDDQRIRRLSQVEALSPATLRRAARVVAGAGLRTGSAGPAMERLIDQSLRIQSRNPRHDPIPPLVVAEYDPSLSQASSDLDALADGLGRTGEGRLCLYGPPGTGKSAFGHWLGERLGRPVTVQRASDLLGAFVGETEANISRAFKQAYQDGSILQIDEVDGFLGDRQQARARWEASLVNEMLTQMEAFRGIFVASTNLMEGLDPAALRRFDAKVLFGYLRPDQSSRLLVALCQRFGLPTPTQSDDALTRLAALDSLTPGDFASAARRHLFDPYRGFSEIVAALADECRLKPGGGARRIGFV
jgi:AAA+ superfamily predicted ATPase